MKRWILLLLLLSPAYGTTIAKIANASCGGLNGCTTSGVDTTGANLIVMSVTEFSSTPTTVSDSKGNTYTALTTKTNNTTRSRLFYKYNATVGASHTFTVSDSGGADGLVVAAFSNTRTSPDPFDVQNGGTGSGTVATQSVTPHQDNEVVVTGEGGDCNQASPTINSSFNTPFGINFGSGVNMGSFMSYIVQTSAAAVNPTWTVCAGQLAATIATFVIAPSHCAACDMSGKLEAPF